MTDSMSNGTLFEGASSGTEMAEASEEFLAIHKDRGGEGHEVLDDPMESELIMRSHARFCGLLSLIIKKER